MTSPAELVASVPVVAWLIVDGLAVFRLARLLTRDTFPPVANLRDAVVRRWPERSLTELAVCPWCVSFWIACGVLAARMLAPEWWTLLAVPLAWSAVTGIIAVHE